MKLILRSTVRERTKNLFSKALQIASAFELVAGVQLPKVCQTHWWSAWMRLSACFRCALSPDLQHLFPGGAKNTLWSCLLVLSIRFWWLWPGGLV
jgi:hypothetical protein